MDLDFWIWILTDLVKNIKISKRFGFDLDLIWILGFFIKSFYFVDLICPLKSTSGFGFVQIRLFCQIRNTDPQAGCNVCCGVQAVFQHGAILKNWFVLSVD